MNSVAYEYRLGFATVSHIIKRTTQALWTVLSKEVFPTQYSEGFWKSVANGFQSTWDFPHCIGAIDGKHCVIQVIYLY